MTMSLVGGSDGEMKPLGSRKDGVWTAGTKSVRIASSVNPQGEAKGAPFVHSSLAEKVYAVSWTRLEMVQLGPSRTAREPQVAGAIVHVVALSSRYMSSNRSNTQSPGDPAMNPTVMLVAVRLVLRISNGGDAGRKQLPA